MGSDTRFVNRVALAIRLHQVVWGFCLSCGRSRRLNLLNIESKFGNITFQELAIKLTCRGCGSRKCTIVPDIEGSPPQETYR